IVNWRNDIDLGMTVVNIVTWDRAGLFYKLAGALTLAHVNIISTKAISRKDHISIDTFYVMDAAGGIVTNTKAEKIFKGHLEDSLIHGKKLINAIEELEKKAAAKTRERDLLPAPFPPSVDVYHELSLKRTIIEVQAEDRIGLLYRLARLIHEKNFNISFARVATERGVAMDTFYIENIDTKEATNTANLLELREELEAIVRAS
ncbi:MAG: ACT domain-containing protein, partial [Verrucomicrobiota bacterium]